MLTLWNQRWRERRGSYRPAAETISTRLYDVEEIPGDSEARAFVLEHHYSGSYPAARFRFGLYRSGQLVGVAVFSHPPSDRVLTSVFDAPARAAVELGRFVLLDHVPGNGETWFLARCFESLRRKELVGVVSFSDPAERTDNSGRRVFGGHVGTIYQAHNAVYLGQASRRTIRLLPDGSVFSARAAQKIRALERGWRYAVDLLERAGAPSYDGSAGWLACAQQAVTRTVRHPGNHKYAWALDRRLRRTLPDSMPYPKLEVAA